MSFLASARATLSPLNLLSRSAERLMLLGDPVSDPVSISSESVMLMESRVIHASFVRGCAAPVAGCDVLRGTNRYLAARQYLGLDPCWGPEA